MECSHLGYVNPYRNGSSISFEKIAVRSSSSAIAFHKLLVIPEYPGAVFVRVFPKAALKSKDVKVHWNFNLFPFLSRLGASSSRILEMDSPRWPYEKESSSFEIRGVRRVRMLRSVECKICLRGLCEKGEIRDAMRWCFMCVFSASSMSGPSNFVHCVVREGDGEGTTTYLMRPGLGGGLSWWIYVCYAFTLIPPRFVFGGWQMIMSISCLVLRYRPCLVTFGTEGKRRFL